MFLKKSAPLLVFGILMAGGASLVVWGWQQVRTQQLLDRGAAVVEARVLDSATRGLHKGGQSWTLVVEYAPAGRETMVGKFDVDGGTYREATASGRASVTYLPSNPKIARVTRFAILPFQFVIGLGGLMLAGGLLCFVHAIRSKA
jgi:hypothetical protein